MSGEKKIRATYKTEANDDGSLRVVFSKEVPGKGKVITFAGDALYQLAEDFASEYEVEDGAKGETEWAVEVEDLDGEDAAVDEDNGGAGMPVLEPDKIIDAEFTTKKPEA